MLPKRAAQFLLVVLFLPRAATSQATTSSEALATLNACSAAMGVLPADVIAEGTHRRFFGKDDAEFSDERLIVKTKTAARVRMEMAEDVYVINNGSGHSLRDGLRQRISSHASAYYRPEHLGGALCALDLQRSEMAPTVLGREEVRGRAAVHIRFRSTADDPVRQILSEFHIYVDQQTGLLLKTESYVFHPEAVENHSRWEVFYSDYRRVGTALIAHRIERFMDGQRHSTITLTSFRTDVAISDSEFE